MLSKGQCISVAEPKYISIFVQTGDPRVQGHKYGSLSHSQHQSSQWQHPRAAMSAAR